MPRQCFAPYQPRFIKLIPIREGAVGDCGNQKIELVRISNELVSADGLRFGATELEPLAFDASQKRMLLCSHGSTLAVEWIDALRFLFN